MRRFFRPLPLAITALACLLLYTLVGFFLVPYVIKAHLLPSVSEQLKRPVMAKEVEFNPFALALRLTGFEIQEKGGAPLLGFEEFFIDLQAVSVIRRAYVFDTIRFTMPFVSVKVAKDGHVNLTDLVPPDESAPPVPASDLNKPKGEIPAVQIGHFEIAQGIVEFRDESKPTLFSIDIVPIGIVLKNFYTKPGGDNTYAFMAELGKGETLAWEGTISLEPIRSEGKLALSGVKLPTLFQYIQDQFKFDIPSGTIQARGEYRFDAASTPIDLEISNTSLHLADISLVEKGEPAPVITVPTLDIHGIQFDLRQRSVSIARFAVADTTARVWRNPDGSINVQTLFAPVKTESAIPQPVSPPAKPASTSAAGEQPWSVALKDIRATNHTVHFEDRSLELPMRAEVTGLSVKTRDVAVPIKGPLPVDVELTLNESGRITVEGQLVVEPFQTDLAIGLKNIAIAPFQPYFEKFARIAVDSGAIDLDGQLHLAVKHPKAPLLTFHGNLGVKALAVADRDQGSPVASWKQLQLRHIALALDPTTVTIDEVGLEQPTVHLVVQPDGQLNLKSLLTPAEAAAPQPAPEQSAPSTKKSAPPSVAINAVKLLKGTATFQDESIEPMVRTGLYDLTGTVKGLSSKQLAKADVDLSGKVDKVAPLKITGRINPLSENAFSDLTIKFDNVDLTPVAPYTGKYVGYPISKGKLFLDLAYKVSQKQLEAENKVAIDQLTFGEQTDSLDATSLPVPLAVALLKDRNGRIDIDLPIRGDLNDPDFKYGRVVLSTLMNLLTKIVASPFTLMAKLVPGGGNAEDLQFVEFEPGSSEIPAAEVKKCEALIKGLEERPGLRLEIIGTADPVRDRQTFRLQKLKAQLLAKWQQERASPKDMDLPVAEEVRLIKELFEQQHGATAGVTTALKPDVTPTPPMIEELRQQLAATIQVDDASLRVLADERAKQIRDQLAGEGKLAEERVFLAGVDLTASDHEKVRSRLNITAGP
jgi:uncharacterized protein DUF748